MIHIGKHNTLKVARKVDFGLYLADDAGKEVLLPSRYVPEGTKIGDEISVFVYNDSDDRLIATTETPHAEVGQFAYLQVTDVNSVGAFVDWGLPKDVLVPYSEQKSKMRKGGVYLVYLYLDHATMRVAATAKIEHYLGNTIPKYHHGDTVRGLVFQRTDIGYKVIVDDLHRGMLYDNEVFCKIEIGQQLTAFVKSVRPDGKIDLTLSGRTRDRVEDIAEAVIVKLKANGGILHISDKSSPEEIKLAFSCSKRDFKKALGMLYKERRIEITGTQIRLN